MGGPEPLLRRRLGRRAAPRRDARGRRRSTSRRSRGRRPVIGIRRAEPGDAQALVELAGEVGSEEGAWLLTTAEWRSVAEERRYLRAVRRHPDAAVYVAEDGEQLVGRLSLARDVHPASSHVADLGLMVAASHRRRGVGRALLEQAVEWAEGAGVRKLELHVLPWNEPAIALYAVVRLRARGSPQGPLPARRCAGRRDPDGAADRPARRRSCLPLVSLSIMTT